MGRPERPETVFEPWFRRGAGLVAAAAAWAFARFWRIAPVGAAYKAKILCSALFVSGRKLSSVLAEDVSVDAYRFLKLFRAHVDEDNWSVTVSWLGLRSRTAAFRPGLGATLAYDAQPLSPAKLTVGRRPARSSAPWPDGEGGPESCPEKLGRALEAAFDEPNPGKLRRTRAVAVVRDGRLLAERYAPGFDEQTPLAGWSMTKSVMGALVGILVGDGRLSVEWKDLLPQWAGAGDSRRAISLDDLLRMRSGLEFAEVYGDLSSDVNRMLWLSPSAAEYAAAKPQRDPPGMAWHYSSGTTNIVSRIVRRAIGGAHQDYLRFPRRALFDRIGMRSAVMEPDAGGDFVGSSFMFATARDWARFGLLYAQDGTWGGERILPEGWVSYGTALTPQSQGRYGAHWWLKLSPEFGGETPAARRIPKDAFFAIGHEGQTITVIPSLKLVAVRLGLAVHVDAWDQAGFLASVLDTLEIS